MQLSESPETTTAPEEFRNVPLCMIIVESQIRSFIDTACESFKSLMASIAEKGVIQPIIVTPRGDGFLLLAGERRFLACQMLGLETIPVRILPDVYSVEEILAIQLIENLQREDIDPIDKANGIVSFIRSRHPEMDPEGIISGLITLRRDETRLENMFALTVSAIVKILGISIPSIINILSLLRLPKDIQHAVRTGAIPVSQGYIFAENRDNPGLRLVLEAVTANPVTNKELIRMLKKAGATGRENAGRPPLPFKSVYASLRTATKELEGGKVVYEAAALDDLLVQLNTLIALVEKAKAGGGTAAAPAPASGTPKVQALAKTTVKVPAKTAAKAAAAKKTAATKTKKPVTS